VFAIVLHQVLGFILWLLVVGLFSFIHQVAVAFQHSHSKVLFSISLPLLGKVSERRLGLGVVFIGTKKAPLQEL